jgi:thiamine pyridinylase
MKKIIFIILSLALLASCKKTNKTNDNRIQLRVALYEYIPHDEWNNFKPLLDTLENTFEKENPSIDLVLKDMDQGDKVDTYRNLNSIKENYYLRNDTVQYHIVETDAVILGDLVKANLIKNLDKYSNLSNYHEAGISASRYNDQLYGIPHWLCGFMLFTRSEEIANSKNLTSLLKSINSPDNKKIDIAGNFGGSWTLPGFYIDALLDGKKTINNYSFLNLNDTIVQDLKSFVLECKDNNGNPCLEEKYKYNTKAEKLFAKDSVDVFFGYTERLKEIIDLTPVKTKDIKIKSLILGSSDIPSLFADVFTINNKCNKDEYEASLKFIEFINSDRIYEMIVLSKDNGSSPRYLIPAKNTVYNIPSIKKDSYYQMIKNELERAKSFPNYGLLENRKKMEAELLSKLKK